MSDQRLHTLFAKQEIRDVLSRYCRGLDRMDKEMAYSVWHEGATADYYGIYKGTDKNLGTLDDIYGEAGSPRARGEPATAYWTLVRREVFTNRDNAVQKTELVIFLRPVVVHEPNLVANTSHLREHLPKADFFTDKPVPGRRNFPPPGLPATAPGSSVP